MWCKFLLYIKVIKLYIYIYTHILFHIHFHYSLLQDIEHSSLCYTVGPILFIMLIAYVFLPQVGGKLLQGRDFCILGS